MTVALWLMPHAAQTSGPARIVNLAMDTKKANFMIGQGGNPDSDSVGISSRLRHSAHPDLKGESGHRLNSQPPLVALKPIQVTMIREQGVSTLFIDGREINTLQAEGDLSNWDQTYPLVLGNDLSGTRPWSGTITRILISDQAIPLELLGISDSHEPNEQPRFLGFGWCWGGW